MHVAISYPCSSILKETALSLVMLPLIPVCRTDYSYHYFHNRHTKRVPLLHHPCCNWLFLGKTHKMCWALLSFSLQAEKKNVKLHKCNELTNVPVEKEELCDIVKHSVFFNLKSGLKLLHLSITCELCILKPNK